MAETAEIMEAEIILKILRMLAEEQLISRKEELFAKEILRKDMI